MGMDSHEWMKEIAQNRKESIVELSINCVLIEDAG